MEETKQTKRLKNSVLKFYKTSYYAKKFTIDANIISRQYVFDLESDKPQVHVSSIAK